MKKIYLIATLVMFGLIGHTQEISLIDSTLYNTLIASQVDNAYSLIWNNPKISESKLDTMNISFAVPSALTCGGTLIDTRDGQQYPTVQIGNQCWMARNLNIGRMISDNSESKNNSTIEKYCYDNDALNCFIYGGLYQWYEMMGYNTTPGTKGICPTGWHIPTDEEWCTLMKYLDVKVNCSFMGSSGIDAGGKLKAIGTMYWYSPNSGATNRSGFTARGAGVRKYDGYFVYHGIDTYFWSSSLNKGDGVAWALSYESADVRRSDLIMTNGFSVRCVRNN